MVKARRVEAMEKRKAFIPVEEKSAQSIRERVQRQQIPRGRII
jgi:hypothetical protein